MEIEPVSLRAVVLIDDVARRQIVGGEALPAAADVQIAVSGSVHDPHSHLVEVVLVRDGQRAIARDASRLSLFFY